MGHRGRLRFRMTKNCQHVISDPLNRERVSSNGVRDCSDKDSSTNVCESALQVQALQLRRIQRYVREESDESKSCWESVCVS